MTPTITFQLEPDAAAIVKRAAARLQLPVMECGDGSFRVLLKDDRDAYLLGAATAEDPEWARIFLKAGGR